MKEKLKNFGNSAVAVVAIGLFLLLGFRGCVGSVWKAPSQSTTYRIRGQDKRTIAITFLPKSRALVSYESPAESFSEAVLWQIDSAQPGRHYIGPLWNVSESGAPILGLRWYSGDAKPVRLRYHVLKRYQNGSASPTLPKEGESRETVLLFSEEALKFSGMWLKAEPADPVEIGALSILLTN